MASYLGVTGILGIYFAYSAVQGNYGIISRLQIQQTEVELERELDLLKLEVERMRNKTDRLSEANLDLDLLDEQARKVLGYVRADEFVIN